jgi:spore coat protein CotH
LILLASGITGCGGLSSEKTQDDSFPFYKDRVATIRIVMEEEDWTFCLTNAFEEQYVPADFWFDDELIPSVGVRPKGNSSLGQAIGWGSPRIPICVDFNIFNRARNFYGVKKVFLNNGWSDPTLIREIVALEVFAEMGVPTPRASLVDLWVNDTHLGVYTMVEMIDRTFIARHFDDASGNLYKPELVAARLDWTEEDIDIDFTSSPFITEQPHHDPILYTNIGGAPLIELLKALGQEGMVSLYTPIPAPEGNMSRGLPPASFPRNYLEAMALKTNENNPDYTGLFRFLEVINTPPAKNTLEDIEAAVDVDELLRYFATSAVVVHLDNYVGIGHNNYLYEVDGKFHMIPWDLNMAFGTFNLGIKKERLINYYIDEPTAGPMLRFPLVYQLLKQPEYMEKYRGYIQECIDGPFNIDRVLARIDQLVAMVRPYVRADMEMFYSYEDWERCLTEDLRPPDIFEGWMAGGPSPQLPFFLSRNESSFLSSNFGVNSLWELFALELTDEDIAKLGEGLSEQTYSLFLQNFYGPLMAPQPPRQPGFGPNSLGLITFIKARYESVVKQLNGEQRSGTGVGMGNGGSMWMADMFAF